MTKLRPWRGYRSGRFQGVRPVLAGLVATGLVISAGACNGGDGGSGDKPSQLVLLSYGGPWDELTQKHVADPFTEETGIEVVIRPGSDDLISQVLAQKNNPQYDLILTGYEDQIFLSEGGALDTIDVNDIPNAADLYPIAINDHGVATSITGVSLLYHAEEVENPPTSWNDLWRPEYAGKVGIPKLPLTYGVDFLMMINKLAGGTEQDVEPGFARLEELRPNVAAVYESSGQAAQLFQQGSITIAPWYSGRVSSMQAAGVPIEKADLAEGDVVYLTMLSPLNGRYNEWVAKFIDIYLSDATQEAFAAEFDSGPSRQSVELPEDVAAKVPYGQAEVDALVQFDWSTILQHRDEWTQRYNRMFSE